MGLSSSQARLLNFTARMHQIEYKAARLESMKLQMANESTRVYEEYLDALDKTKIQVKNLNTDGSVTYKDPANYGEFLGAGYALDYKGVVYDGARSATGVADGNLRSYIITASDAADTSYAAFMALKGLHVGDMIYFDRSKIGSGMTAAYVDKSKVTADRSFERLVYLAYGGTTAPTGEAFETVLTNLINSGEVTIVAKDKDGNFKQESAPDFDIYETSVSTNTGLQEVTDEVNLKKAEAKYEADMKRIDLKDRKYDTDLAALDAERNAIKQEMETLKTVAKDNVERTFKLFS